MIGFTAFKTRKPREFNYRPRYYDPEQEAWEGRKKEVRADREMLGDTFKDSDEEYVPGQYVRQIRIRRGVTARRMAEKKNKAGNVRIIILIVLSLALLWWVFS